MSETFPLVFTLLNAPLPDTPGIVIPSEQVESMFDAHNVLLKTRCKAARMLRQARVRRKAWHLQQAQLSAKRQKQEALEWEVQQQQKCQQAVDEAIVWLVDSQSLVNSLAEDIRQRALALTVMAMQQVSQNIDWSAVVQSHIDEALEFVMDGDNAILFTHSSTVDYFSDYAKSRQLNVQVCGDDSYVPGTALLKTPLMQIAIDAKRTFNEVKEALSAASVVKKAVP